MTPRRFYLPILFAFVPSCGSILVTRPNSGAAVGVPYSLPRTVLEVKASVEPKLENGVLTGLSAGISGVTRYVGDPKHRYVLTHSTSAFHDDTLKIQVDEQGLLTSVETKADSQTLEAVKQLASGLSSFAKLALGDIGLQAEDPLKPLIDQALRELAGQLLRDAGTRTLNLSPPPTSMQEFQEESPFGEKSPWKLRWRLRDVDSLDEGDAALGVVPKEGVVSKGTADQPQVNGKQDNQGGVLVRTPEAYVLEIKLTFDGSGVRLTVPSNLIDGADRSLENAKDLVAGAAARAGVIAYVVSESNGEDLVFELSPRPTVASSSAIVVLPDHGPIVRLPLDRVAFANTDHKLTFRSGMVASLTVERGNSAVNVVSLPVTIAEAIVRIPAELVKFQVELTGDQGKLLDAMAELEKKIAQQGRSANDIGAEAQIEYNEAYVAALAAKAAFVRSEDEAAPFDERLQKWGDYLNKATLANAKAAALDVPAPFPLTEIRQQQPHE